MSFPKRGDVYLVNLDPTVGSEIKKTRPAVILQNDVGNQYSRTTIIAPVRSGGKAIYPVEVLVKSPEGGLNNDSLILLSQIRVVDKSRLGKRLGALKRQTLEPVNEAIMISLGLIPI